MSYTIAQAGLILNQFDRAGRQASYHYADDTGGEWNQGDDWKRKALAIYDAHPELHLRMRVIARGFLWSLDIERKVA